ncbi:MAG: hypothetical protein RDU59_06170 [Thermodesulfobacteriota bacterium]|nr:hypothetical protein [Thermodesulfobacteriota bacterium]
MPPVKRLFVIYNDLVGYDILGNHGLDRQHMGKAMQPIQKAITGKEEQGDLSTPYQSFVQFYCAFNSGDIKMGEYGEYGDVNMGTLLKTITYF